MSARRMRAAVLREQGRPAPYRESRPLEIVVAELDGPGPGEVLVRVAAAGLCHSDLSAIAGQRARTLPAVAGHEAAGVVEEVGPGVTTVAPGDHVVMVFVASCGVCPACVSGRASLCESSWTARSRGTLPGGARRLRVDGEPVHHYSGLSAFAEYAVTSETSLVRIDPEVPLLDAAVLGCAVVTGVGAVLFTADVPAGASVLVSGLGGVGLSALLGARLAGAATIVAVDVTPEKLALARDLGATHALDAREPGLADAVRDVTGGGVDHAFEMAGVAASIETCYEATRRGGTVVVAALPDPSATFAVPLARHASDERVLKGSYMGSCVPRRDVPRLAALYRAGRLPVDRLRSRTLTLDEINEGFDRLRDGLAVRDVVVLDPDAARTKEIR